MWCNLVGSTLAFGSIGREIEFTPWCISLQQADITDIELTGRFIPSPVAVVHSASYPPGKTRRVAAYQW